MAATISSSLLLVVALTLCLFANQGSSLQVGYYSSTCPKAESIVTSTITSLFRADIFTAGAIVRLFFHDCAVQGCDASILINTTTAEYTAPDNVGLRYQGFVAIKEAKEAVEAVCPGVVSCADILALATRDIVALTFGPSYQVECGRFDGLVSNGSEVPGLLPEPTDSMNTLIAVFGALGLNMTDLIVLSAAHTIGLAHCKKFNNRLYPTQDPLLNPSYAPFLKSQCPSLTAPDNSVLMDPKTPALFDNQYFKNLENGDGLFSSDEVLFTDPRSAPLVKSLAGNAAAFSAAWVTAITNLGRVNVKTAANGNIRLVCDELN